MAEQITVIEIQGDASETDVRLVVQKTAIGSPAPGAQLGGSVVASGVPGLSFLVITAAPTSGGMSLTVEEVQGDTDTATQEIVIEKAALGLDAVAGTSLSGFQVQRPSGNVLVIPLDEAAA